MTFGSELRSRDGTGGANIGAGTTILAFGRVDYIVSIDLRNCALGAFCFASAALNAVVLTNHVSHKSFLSSHKVLVGCYHIVFKFLAI
jgi:hypothetical protein